MFAEPPPVRVIEAPIAPSERVWRGTDTLLGIGVLIASLVVVTVLLGIVLVIVDPGKAGEDTIGALFTIVFEGLFGLTVLAMAARRHVSLLRLGFRKPERWGPLPIVVVAAYATLLGYGLLLSLLNQLGVDTSWFEGGNQIPLQEGESHGLTLYAMLALFGFAVVVVAPLAEELFFRGLLFRSLDEVWPGWAAIVASGCAFGIFHLNPAVLVPFSVIGMLFAWAFRASGSLWVTVLAHFTINMLSFIVTIWEVTR